MISKGHWYASNLVNDTIQVSWQQDFFFFFFFSGLGLALSSPMQSLTESRSNGVGMRNVRSQKDRHRLRLFYCISRLEMKRNHLYTLVYTDCFPPHYRDCLTKDSVINSRPTQALSNFCELVVQSIWKVLTLQQKSIFCQYGIILSPTWWSNSIMQRDKKASQQHLEDDNNLAFSSAKTPRKEIYQWQRMIVILFNYGSHFVCLCA